MSAQSDIYQRNVVTLNGMQIVFASGEMNQDKGVTLFSEAMDLVFCLNGAITWQMGREKYIQNAHQLLYFSRGSCYKILSTKPETLIIRIRFFKNQVSEELMKEERFTSFNIDCDKLKKRINSFGISLVDSILKKDEPLSKEAVDVFLEEAQLISKAVSDFQENDYFCLENAFPKLKLKDKTKKALDLISDCYGDKNFDLELLSEKIGISRSYLIRTFKNDTGVVPSFYLNLNKISDSLSLITKQDTELSDVAYELGFSDQSHFSNIFKKYMKMTPGQLKKPVDDDFKTLILKKIGLLKTD